MLVTSAQRNGQVLTAIDLMIDPAARPFADVRLRADFDSIDGHLDVVLDPAPGKPLDGAVVRWVGFSLQPGMG